VIHHFPSFKNQSFINSWIFNRKLTRHSIELNIDLFTLKWKVVWHQQVSRLNGHQAYFQSNFEMCFYIQYKMSQNFCPCYLDCDLSKGCLMLMLNIISFHLGISYSFTWFTVHSRFFCSLIFTLSCLIQSIFA